MPWHMMARPSPGRKRTRAHGTDPSMKHRTMTPRAAAPMPAFHSSSKTLADRGALNIDGVSRLKNIRLNLLVQIKIFLGRSAGLFQVFLLSEFFLFKILREGLAESFFFRVAEA